MLNSKFHTFYDEDEDGFADLPGNSGDVLVTELPLENSDWATFARHRY